MSYWRTLRAFFGAGDTDVAEVRIDASTHALEIIDYAHHEIHSGSSFVVSDVINVSTATQKWMITTPATTVYAHEVLDVECTGEMLALITEGADRTGTTLLDVVNRRRVGTPAAATTTVHRDVSAGTTDGAQTIRTVRSGSTGVGGKTVAAGGTRGLNEFVLKPDTKYVIAITTYADVYVSLGLGWYEHEDKD